MGYTYDDFVSAATGAGMLEKFDKMDLETAKKNPEFGLSLLSLKKDAAAATTDEQRLLATEAANQLRKSYGSYTIGENGASEYAGSFGQQVTDTMGKLQNYGDYSYGQEDAYQKLLEAVANPKEFSYDPETDPVYSAYKKAFLREGERATAQALAQASAATGGRPSSYAVTAATQAGNNYAGKLADIIPSLFQGAYDRHNADLSAKLSSLSALSGDRQFDYGKWLDGYNQLQGMLGNLQTQDNTEYGRYLDAWNMAQQAEKEEFEKKLAAAELMATKKDYTLLGQLYGLTQEQIDVLNGVKKTAPGPGNEEVVRDDVVKSFMSSIPYMNSKTTEAQAKNYLDNMVGTWYASGRINAKEVDYILDQLGM